MKAKPPVKRRKSTSDWDEIDDLYQTLLYWLYERENAGKAGSYADRLARLLATVDPAHESIFGEECWSLIYETRGETPKAIEHRENEVRLMRRLHELSGASAEESPALEGRGHSDLSDRLDLLATLYHDNGDPDRAISLLRESKQLCEIHGIEYDGQDILDEYLDEQRSAQEA
jgi:hypothetical protein